MEKQIDKAGGDLKDIRVAANDIKAQMMAFSRKEGSVLTVYADDDEVVWRNF